MTDAEEPFRISTRDEGFIYSMRGNDVPWTWGESEDCNGLRRVHPGGYQPGRA